MAVFSDVYTRIEREVLKQTATVYLTDVKNAVVSAIRFFEHKPIWFTETVGSDLTVTSGTGSVALPTNFASMADLRVYDGTRYRTSETGFEFLEFKGFRAWKANDPNYTSTPRKWTIFGGNVLVDSTVSANTTIQIDYYKKDTAYPSAAGDTSIWFEEGQDLIRHEAMSIFYGDRLHDETNEAKYHAKAMAWYDALNERSNLRVRRRRLA